MTISTLKTFIEGEAIKASDTNDNNQYLLSQTQSGYNTLNSRITTLQGNLETSITTLSGQCVKLTGAQTVSGNKTFSGTNTFTGTTKVPASATAGTAVSTVAISKGANGYIKFGNGIILQWGVVSGPAGAKTVTFPTAFTSSNVRVITQCLYTSQTNGYQGTISAVTATTFNCYVSYANGIYWFAIGY